MRVGVLLRRRRELAEADCKVPENGSRTNEHGGNRYRQKYSGENPSAGVRCGVEKKRRFGFQLANDKFFLSHSLPVVHQVLSVAA